MESMPFYATTLPSKVALRFVSLLIICSLIVIVNVSSIIVIPILLLSFFVSHCLARACPQDNAYYTGTRTLKYSIVFFYHEGARRLWKDFRKCLLIKILETRAMYYNILVWSVFVLMFDSKYHNYVVSLLKDWLDMLVYMCLSFYS